MKKDLFTYIHSLLVEQTSKVKYNNGLDLIIDIYEVVFNSQLDVTKIEQSKEVRFNEARTEDIAIYTPLINANNEIQNLYAIVLGVSIREVVYLNPSTFKVESSTFSSQLLGHKIKSIKRINEYESKV